MIYKARGREGPESRHEKKPAGSAIFARPLDNTWLILKIEKG